MQSLREQAATHFVGPTGTNASLPRFRRPARLAQAFEHGPRYLVVSHTVSQFERAELTTSPFGMTCLTPFPTELPEGSCRREQRRRGNARLKGCSVDAARAVT